MATVLFDGFDDGSIQRINEWIKRLEALLSIESPTGFLERIEEHLRRPPESGPSPGPYTPDEFGALIGKSGDTVREGCRKERIVGYKIKAMAGDTQQWRINHSELVRYKAEGLLPEKEPQQAPSKRPRRRRPGGFSKRTGFVGPQSDNGEPRGQSC